MSFKRCAYLSLFLLFSLFYLPLAEGGQMAYLKILLNEEEKGELIVQITDEGDFLVRAEDLRKMGFPEVKGMRSIIEGEEYISIKSIEGLQVKLNEKKLTLEILADPQILEKKIFFLRYPRQPKVYFPKDTAGFLNYGVTYYAKDSITYDKTVLTNRLGFRTGDFLFLTDSSYGQQAGEGGRFVRLMSNITYDRREDLLRGIAGDFFASSGELGSTLNMGGLSFSKNYLIDPYFIKYPEVSFSGLTSLPSEIELYRDGVLIKKDRVSPGGFKLQDIPTYVGAGLVEVVLRDPFGREHSTKLPYYFSDTLLKKGLHEYSYNLGYLREDFGVVSNRYKDFVFLGFHRYGINDSLTAGVRGEVSGDVMNVGLTSTYLLPKQLGLISGSLAWSDSEEKKDGWGGSINYLYQDRNLSFNLLLRGYTRDFSNLSLEKTLERIKYETSTGAGYFSSLLGSLSLSFSIVKKYLGMDTKTFSAGYSRKITDCSNIAAVFRRDIENDFSEFTIFFNYYFKYGITASASYQKENGTSKERIQVSKNPPFGEGFGGRASFERYHGHSDAYNNYNLQLQYNAKYGQVSGEILGVNHREAYSLSAAGGFSFVKDSFNLSRPIEDSFALVKVGDLKGVRVYLNSQEIGKTGNSGKVLIPKLSSYYDNYISISDKDIPIEYSLTDVTKYVSPPLGSGSYIEFGTTKIQAFVGTLKIKIHGEIKLLEYMEFKLTVHGKELVSSTGKGGELYFENITPGKYKGEFKYLDKNITFDIIFPKSEDILVDLGDILCE